MSASPFSGAGMAGTAGGVLAQAQEAKSAINRASRLDSLLHRADRIRDQAGNLAERVQTVANRVIGMPPPSPTASGERAEPVADSSLGRIEQTLEHASTLLEALHAHLQRLEAL